MLILNQREFRLAKARAAQIWQRLQHRSLLDEVAIGLPPDVTSARQDTLAEEHERLSEAISNFEQLAAGNRTSLVEAHELGLIPIYARIARKLSQKELADLLGLKEQQIQRYESERYSGISLSRYRRLLDVLGVELDPKFGKSIPEGPHDNDTMPPVAADVLRAIKDRQWFDVGPDVSPEALREHLKILISNAGIERRLFHRQTRTRSSNDASLKLWSARILALAESARPRITKSFDVSDISWIPEFVRLSRLIDGPQQAANYLRRRGIVFIVEPHLPRTHLDGAATVMPDGAPIVALTLRYDRLDNFWFTLMHEIAHIVLHYGALIEGFLDDLDEAPEDEREHQADSFARNMLIPDEVWASAPARFSTSRSQVEAFATARGIHPAIVVGRIRRERDDYTLFPRADGRGTVRSIFGLNN